MSRHSISAMRHTMSTGRSRRASECETFLAPFGGARTRNTQCHRYCRHAEEAEKVRKRFYFKTVAWARIVRRLGQYLLFVKFATEYLPKKNQSWLRCRQPSLQSSLRCCQPSLHQLEVPPVPVDTGAQSRSKVVPVTCHAHRR